MAYLAMIEPDQNKNCNKVCQPSVMAEFVTNMGLLGILLTRKYCLLESSNDKDVQHLKERVMP